MMRWLLIIVLLVALTFRSVWAYYNNTAAVIERRKDYSNQALVSITLNDKCDLKYLQKLVKESRARVRYRNPREWENQMELWNEVINEVVLMRVPRSILSLFETDLNNRNMEYKVVARDLQKLLRQESEEFEPSTGTLLANYDDSKDFFNTYHSVEVITKFLQSFTRKYADISKLQVIGYSYEKRPLLAVKISVNSARRKNRNQSNAKKMILMDCGCHAREWASISFCLYFMNRLITDYKQGNAQMKKILGKYDFTIIPMLNPDGYKYSQTVDRFWRKNRSKNKDSNCYGVDLNRNFDAGFRSCDASGACLEDYCGHIPFSEPESRSLDRLLRKNKGRIKAYFAVHCYSQLWLIPWAKSSKSLPKNYEDLLRVANKGAEAIRKRYGTEFVVGMPSKLLYASGGTSMDYVYEKGFAEYSYALELRDTGEHGFLLPKEQIPELNEETTDGFLAAISAMT